jgi:hypothetical protein
LGGQSADAVQSVRDNVGPLMYAKQFFDLQLEFAERVSALSALPFARAVLDYTNFYIRFGFGRDFDPAHAGWQEYLGGLLGAADRSAWTYRFYATRSSPVVPPGFVAMFGCFSYARLSNDRIRLHFHDADRDGRSPLGSDRRDRRVAELAALFADVKHLANDTLRVVGASWLYNIPAYRYLFPESYLATAHPIHGRFRHMPLWGQFMNRGGEVRENMAREFRERLRRHSGLEGLDQCFPLQVLSLEASVRDFYRFYRL